MTLCLSASVWIAVGRRLCKKIIFLLFFFVDKIIAYLKFRLDPFFKIKLNSKQKRKAFTIEFILGKNIS